MINTLNEINKSARDDAAEFIKACNREYLDSVTNIAKRIADDDDIIIVSIAGPSGSGKTTTAHILQATLEKMGEKTAVVSLDDFYLPHNELPVLSDGTVDIESVNALDIALIKKCFEEIIANGKTTLPEYNFKTRSRNCDAKLLDIGTHGIVIVEGLHAMNPVITDLVPHNNILKVYISPNRTVDDENGVQLLSSRQLRLVRRVLRDDLFRGASATETLSLWNNVIEGEKIHLYCFKNTADVLLTTFHPYEPCVYRERFCKMRSSVNKNSPCYEFFIDTVNALEHFASIDSALVPPDSLIREFIGDLSI